MVSGHYDSMCGSPTDAKCDAPGANDDASGTAAVLEMARVMAKYKFDATIVFMAVAGRRTGLAGRDLLRRASEERKTWISKAMFTNDIIGNSLGGNGVRDRRTVRVFSEGVPSNESQAEANTRRSVGGENDSQLETTGALHSRSKRPLRRRQCKWLMIYRRDRYGRGGDHHSVSRARFCRRSDLLNRTKSFVISIRTCGWRTEFNTGTCRSLSTLITSQT